MAESAEDPEVFWVQPEARGIISFDNFHVSRSLRKVVRQGRFEIRLDTDFDGVINGCAQTVPDRDQTWINAPIREAYGELFVLGHCHTVEAWQSGDLVGGLYGVSLGRAFFGESMFSRVTDASKVCLVRLVEHLKAQGFELLDTQFNTEHLSRFGATEIPKSEYETLLRNALRGKAAVF